jgi:hypothetical protein
MRGFSRRVSEGTRTPDRLDHNQELYQLSYAHRGIAESTSATSVPGYRPGSYSGSAITRAVSHSSNSEISTSEPTPSSAGR